MAQVAAQPPLFWYCAVVLFGLIAGSFINVVIVRLPRMMEASWRASAAEILALADEDAAGEQLTLACPRSHCPHCGAPVAARHNIPVLSFVWLRGRCAACGARISWQYPLVEIASAALAVGVFARFGASAFTGFALIVSWMLLAQAVIDWRTQFLPDSLTLPLLWLGLIASLGHDAGFARVGPGAAIAGAAAGYLVLWLVYQAFLRVTGKQGMGYGDFKLSAAIGAWLGWQALPMVLLIASAAGALIGTTLMATGVLERDKPMPFGPWLAAAGWLALVAGDTIMRAYWALAGLS